MKMLLFDTETTDLNPGQIGQLSYLIIDMENMENKIEGKNFFFSVNYVNPSASAVTGLTREKLCELSGDKIFSDYLEEIFEDFTNVDMIIAHNINFDIKFITAEFKRCGYEFKPKLTFCSMKYYTDICKIPSKHKPDSYKFPKLEEAINFVGIDNEKVNELCKKIYKGSEASFHDSRYDIVATYMLLRTGIYKGYMPRGYLSDIIKEDEKMLHQEIIKGVNKMINFAKEYGKYGLTKKVGIVLEKWNKIYMYECEYIDEEIFDTIIKHDLKNPKESCYCKTMDLISFYKEQLKNKIHYKNTDYNHIKEDYEILKRFLEDKITLDKNRPIHTIFPINMTKVKVQDIVEKCEDLGVDPNSLIIMPVDTSYNNEYYGTTDNSLDEEELTNLVNIGDYDGKIDLEMMKRELNPELEFVRILDENNLYFGLHDKSYIYYHKGVE